MRAHCGKDLGDAVRVRVELDDQPRELELPPDLAAALGATGGALEKFSSLAYYLRREAINHLNAAKTQPTRDKRLQALLDKLRS